MYYYETDKNLSSPSHLIIFHNNIHVCVWTSIISGCSRWMWYFQWRMDLQSICRATLYRCNLRSHASRQKLHGKRPYRRNLPSLEMETLRLWLAIVRSRQVLERHGEQDPWRHRWLAYAQSDRFITLSSLQSQLFSLLPSPFYLLSPKDFTKKIFSWIDKLKYTGYPNQTNFYNSITRGTLVTNLN